MSSHLNFSKKLAKADRPKSLVLNQKETQDKTTKPEKTKKTKPIKKNKNKAVPKKKLTKRQKSTLIQHLWARRRTQSLRMHSNYLFTLSPSLLLRGPTPLAPEDYPSAQAQMIYNDQKEPLLRAFEMHANQKKSSLLDKTFKKIVTDKNMEQGVLSLNSQSTEADSADASRSGLINNTGAPTEEEEDKN